MAKIEIYTTMICPYCHAAKELLAKKDVSYTEISLNRQPDQRDKMLTRAGGSHTVPQIFIDDAHIGGCDDLYALEASGDLDRILTG